MKFSWEKIHEQREKGVYWFATYRAKVFGGWIVRNFDSTIENQAVNSLNLSTSESSVFVPDPNHEWSIEE